MVLKDDEIEKSRTQDQALTAAAKREAAEKKRLIRILTGSALKAKKSKDARAFAKQLKLGNVSENSPEWKKAWDYFYDRL